MPTCVAIGELVTLESVKLAHIGGVMLKCETLDQAAKVLGIKASTLWRIRGQNPELKTKRQQRRLGGV